ncbi:macro domain-containing protein [Dokdonella sp.]|uniref:type II toxin-antitoxin system antitoxin DNA ADP-ribosyl glycohydrolase DarG n=1 Tax=Dokdonella sp. TaxID=2291710 RepID=UPI0027BA625F|nr:macro domain-containing protein [Dokdonella sp.]
MFKVLIGDLFESRAQTLVNTVNCVGVMGKGVAAEFKKRYPAMFNDYASRCERKAVRLGEPYLYVDASGARVVNFPTKGHWRAVSRIADIESGLDWLAAHAAEWGVTSMAMPPLGCGNGGLEWAEVAPLVWRKLHELPIDVELYAPYGTPKTQLTLDFLSAPSQMSLQGKGERAAKMQPEWVVLMEVLRQLQEQPYANPVGSTIFQKICYVVTEMGVPTGLAFDKGSYGPFSHDVKQVLHEFANRNWVQQAQLGRMLALRVEPASLKDRQRFRAEIAKFDKKIAKAVDLFSRIKSTEQAEEVMTVLYASRQLKRERPRDEVAELELLDYIVDWKQSWNSEEKKQAVAEAIRNLVLLGWMRARISPTLLEAA